MLSNHLFINKKRKGEVRGKKGQAGGGPEEEAMGARGRRAPPLSQRRLTGGFWV
jgi:hypothetical protein